MAFAYPPKPSTTATSRRFNALAPKAMHLAKAAGQTVQRWSNNVLKPHTAPGPRSNALSQRDATSGLPITIIQLRDIVGYLRLYWRQGTLASILAASLVFSLVGCGDKVYEAQSTLAARIQEPSLLDIDHRGGGLTEQSAIQIVNNHLTSLRTQQFWTYCYSELPKEFREKYIADAAKLSLPKRLLVAVGISDQPRSQSQLELFGRKLNLSMRVDTVKDSHMIRVVVRDDDAEVAATLASALAQSYVKYQEEIAAKGADEAQRRLLSKVQDAKTRLNDAEMVLAEFSQQSDLMKSGETADMSALLAQELAKARASLDVELLRAQQRVKQLRAAVETKGGVGGVRGLGDDQQIIELSKVLSVAQSRLDSLLEYCGPNHPKLLQASSEVERLEIEKRDRLQSIVAAEEGNEQRLLSEKEDLSQRLAKARQQAFSTSPNRIRQQQLVDDVESLRTMHTSLLKQQEAALLASELRGNAKVDVIDLAQVPDGAVWPKKSLALLASLVVFGLCSIGFPVGLGLSQDYLWPLLSDLPPVPKPAPLRLVSEAVTPSPTAFPSRKLPTGTTSAGSPALLAVLPTLRALDEQDKLHELLTSTEATGNPAMAAVLQSLESAYGSRRGTRIVLVTSARGQQGKSLTSAAIAGALLQAGNRVLLLECHPAAASLHQWFPMQCYGPEDAASIEALRYGQSNLFLLKAAQLPGADVSLLVGEYKAWIDAARATGVEWVVMDCGSLLEDCADLMRLIPLATDVILVHDAERSGAGQMKAMVALHGLIANPKTLRGVVLNQFVRGPV